MTYKLIALDIDGTIRSPEYEISTRTRTAINRVIEAGAVVTVATGRMFESARMSTKTLDLKSPIVSFQGAHVANPVTGELLWHMPLTGQQTIDALDALNGWSGDLAAYLNDDVFVTKLTPWAKGYSERNHRDIQLVENLRTLASRRPTRLLAIGDPDEIFRLENQLNKQFDSTLHVTRSLPTFCEILHPDGGKHKALQWLCKYLGIDPQHTIAFGNGYNDVHMLEWAATGVAVGNSVPEVLDIADRIAPPLEQDGTAQILEELLENGKIG
jgi:Cof subfamily protein (haloacid dehalogenase superfamily)